MPEHFIGPARRPARLVSTLGAILLLAGCDPPIADPTATGLQPVIEHARSGQNIEATVGAVVGCLSGCAAMMNALESEMPPRPVERRLDAIESRRFLCRTLYDQLTPDEQARVAERADDARLACIGPDAFDAVGFCHRIQGPHLQPRACTADDPCADFCLGSYLEDDLPADSDRCVEGDLGLWTCPVTLPLMAEVECPVIAWHFHIDERCELAGCAEAAPGSCMALSTMTGGDIDLQVVSVLDSDPCGNTHFECVVTGVPAGTR